MRFVGASVERVEDHRILTGRGNYVDDVQLPNMLHAAFLRSPFAHASIRGIDAGAGLGSPGVVAVLTGEDVQAQSNPITSPLAGLRPLPGFHPLAPDKVPLRADPVAVGG